MPQLETDGKGSAKTLLQLDRANLYLQQFAIVESYHQCDPFLFHCRISGETPFYERGELGIHGSDDRIGLCENVHINKILKGGTLLRVVRSCVPPIVH